KLLLKLIVTAGVTVNAVDKEKVTRSKPIRRRLSADDTDAFGSMSMLNDGDIPNDILVESLGSMPVTADFEDLMAGDKSAYITSDNDFQWIVGNYTDCTIAGVALMGGHVVETVPTRECSEGANLLVSPIPDGAASSRIFEAEWQTYYPCNRVNITKVCPNVGGQESTILRRVYQGVGSFSSKYAHEITFYSDFMEYLDGDILGSDYKWVSFGNEMKEDVSTLRCVYSGEYSIVCDKFTQSVVEDNGAHYQAMATYVFSKADRTKSSKSAKGY
ncbi:hypothetical protein ACHAWF_010144, partial [Thalassiosira exigua]